MDYFLAVKAFNRIVETGSFVKAAAQLDLHPNVVTKLVQGLESHLHVRLLNRTTRRVTLTSEGDVYYARMSHVLDQWLEVESEMAVTHANPKGRIRVDMGTTIATHLVIPALSAFHARYPNIQIDIGASDRTADLVSENIDCVIRGGDLRDSSLIARRLGSVDFVTCATPAYLAVRESLCHPSQLENSHPIVRYVFPSSGKHNRIEFVRGDEQIVIDGSYLVAVNDSNGYLAAGLASLGVIHTLRFMVQPHIDSGALIPVLEDWSARANTLSVVYMPNRHLSVRVRAFVDWLVAYFAAHPHVLA
ncbi:LysR family transcriptional regulator [Pseudomonas sp. CCC3.1]|uniref:LysR substrate-binding domain-containing protein n=1 Tax=Pseudomonas sp. CCC3.1 TaxID=3048607 RepID=UPI002AC92117|nr:LysR family transcriptional regulator [Pseudomonas sp. CCC3.1]MEB0204676.1 LysR family transcriptional regulator [Pseudomonas sp. CCC3.1]WPX38629.1 LysR family transcriptional regulator [Pseudomonas sp. CCC3.1]